MRSGLRGADGDSGTGGVSAAPVPPARLPPRIRGVAAQRQMAGPVDGSGHLPFGQPLLTVLRWGPCAAQRDRGCCERAFSPGSRQGWWMEQSTVLVPLTAQPSRSTTTWTFLPSSVV
ncbi:hypothetical protein GCM10015536_21360 [Streptomyces griseomycini]|nr:hypothetical protein GCM10015536_21360 [Streptomyces griseomycini]